MEMLEAAFEREVSKRLSELKHQVATGLSESTSLEGCPFHYCDSNPVCENRCRYNYY